MHWLVVWAYWAGATVFCTLSGGPWAAAPIAYAAPERAIGQEPRFAIGVEYIVPGFAEVYAKTGVPGPRQRPLDAPGAILSRNHPSAVNIPTDGKPWIGSCWGINGPGFSISISMSGA